MAETASLASLSSIVHHPAVRAMASGEDNWKGKTSPAERRKIQNRLNQRTWRQRRKLEQQQRQNGGRGAGFGGIDASISESQALVAARGSRWAASSNDDATRAATYIYKAAIEVSRSSDTASAAVGAQGRRYAKNTTLMALAYIGRRRSFLDLRDEDMDALYDLFLARAALSGSVPMSDSLLPLVQFNLFRGLMVNMKTMGLNLSMICDEDCVSPIGTNPAYNARTAWADVPIFLRPTDTQLSVVHHPWMDFLPLPRMRDNLIRADGTYDDEDLCLDMIGDGDAPSGKGEMILWGDPWDPMNWEVTELFVVKWRWVLEGCEEMIRSSNYWRAQRGERKMRVKFH